MLIHVSPMANDDGQLTNWGQWQFNFRKADIPFSPASTDPPMPLTICAQTPAYCDGDPPDNLRCRARLAETRECRRVTRRPGHSIAE
jgi:hypothetical protein